MKEITPLEYFLSFYGINRDVDIELCKSIFAAEKQNKTLIFYKRRGRLE